jgi:hypothetical protein
MGVWPTSLRDITYGLERNNPHRLTDDEAQTLIKIFGLFVKVEVIWKVMVLWPANVDFGDKLKDAMGRALRPDGEQESTKIRNNAQ